MQVLANKPNLLTRMCIKLLCNQWRINKMSTITNLYQRQYSLYCKLNGDLMLSWEERLSIEKEMNEIETLLNNSKHE